MTFRVFYGLIMPRVTVESTTRECLSQLPANTLDSLMQDALRLFWSPKRKRDGIRIGTTMVRKMQIDEACDEAVSRVQTDPGVLYLEVISSSSFSPSEVFNHTKGEGASTQPTWGVYFSEVTSLSVELEIIKRFPALRKVSRARWDRFASKDYS